MPDVPFVAQPPAQCAGASLAMVMRYWGVTELQPSAFEEALLADGTGTPTARLRQLAAEQGFDAVVLAGDRATMETHLARGRPLIALLEAGPGRYHYVVVLARQNGRVLFHDPAEGPLRVLSEDEWCRRSRPAREWALLLRPRPRSEETATGPTGGVARPEPPAANRWLDEAGAEFRRENWRAAGDLAERALAEDGDEALARRVVATSRFLEGRRSEALSAWNALGEPRLDLVRVDGLDRTSHRDVLAYLGVRPGQLVTPELMARSEERLRLLPAASASRLDLRPRPDGRADLEGAVLERRPWPSGRSFLAEAAVHSLTDNAASADLRFVYGTGDLLRLEAYWHPNRQRAALSAASVRALGLPGIVHVSLSGDEQSYAFRTAPADGDLRERRRHAGLGLENWWTASLRARVDVSADDWSGRARTLGAATRIEQHFFSDRVALAGRAGGFWSRERPFFAASAEARARTSASDDTPAAAVVLAYDVASAYGPLALWPGAGTGSGRGRFLRGHRLVIDGTVAGPAFGPSLWSGSVEAGLAARSVGPMRVHIAAFADVARPSVRLGTAPLPKTYVDLGLGLRARLPGQRSTLRLDAAVPVGGTGVIVSAGFAPAWR